MLHEAARLDDAARFECLCADALELPLPDASVDLLFSNLMLPWCDDLDAAFAEIARVLRPRGLLTFTTLGPDTLIELHESWHEADDYTHVIPFADMHDIGDGLVRAGLVEPVLDVVHYTLTYPDVYSLMRDLKAIGARNATTGRPRGLTGRQALRMVEQTYERHRHEGRLPASYEVIFGQAWGAVERPDAGNDGEFASSGFRDSPPWGQRIAMSHGYFVTGTDTGVGKTLVTAALLRRLRESGVGGRGHETGRRRCGRRARGTRECRCTAAAGGIERPPSLRDRESLAVRSPRSRRTSRRRKPVS